MARPGGLPWGCLPARPNGLRHGPSPTAKPWAAELQGQAPQTPRLVHELGSQGPDGPSPAAHIKATWPCVTRADVSCPRGQWDCAISQATGTGFGARGTSLDVCAAFHPQAFAEHLLCAGPCVAPGHGLLPRLPGAQTHRPRRRSRCVTPRAPPALTSQQRSSSPRASGGPSIPLARPLGLPGGWRWGLDGGHNPGNGAVCRRRRNLTCPFFLQLPLSQPGSWEGAPGLPAGLPALCVPGGVTPSLGLNFPCSHTGEGVSRGAGPLPPRAPQPPR